MRPEDVNADNIPTTYRELKDHFENLLGPNKSRMEINSFDRLWDSYKDESTKSKIETIKSSITLCNLGKRQMSLLVLKYLWVKVLRMLIFVYIPIDNLVKKIRSRIVAYKFLSRESLGMSRSLKTTGLDRDLIVPVDQRYDFLRAITCKGVSHIYRDMINKAIDENENAAVFFVNLVPCKLGCGNSDSFNVPIEEAIEALSDHHWSKCELLDRLHADGCGCGGGKGDHRRVDEGLAEVAI